MQKTSDKKKNQKRSNLIEFGAAILILIFVNLIGHYLFARLDLTAEHRYTLSKTTKQMLKEVDETVIFHIYLEGDLPSDYQRLQNETREMLNQFRAYNRNIEYEFVNPNSFEEKEEQQVFYQKLAQKGIQPAFVQVETQNGVTQQILIPAADVSYKGRETSVQLLQNQAYVANDVALNNSIQNLEYVLSNAIRQLTVTMKPKIGFLLGHGELQGAPLYDIQMTLLENYRLENVLLTRDSVTDVNALTMRNRAADSTMKFANKYDLLVIPKPLRAFSDQELYLIDQYVMYGGKVLWLVDPVDADMDSLSEVGQAVVTRLPENLDEMFFNYGVRVNPDLVMDIRCRPIPITVGMIGNQPQIDFRPWLYFPDLVPTSQHPIVRNLDMIKTDFVSSIDLIENDIDKTVLLATSEYSRIKNAPVILDLAETKVDVQQLDQRLFNKQNLPVAVLLEGQFRSMWRNRLAPSFTALPEMGYRDQSQPTKMIVISDGDLIKNRYSMRDNATYPLGYDYYTETMYANKQFLLNCIDYLAGNEELLSTRSRDVRMRKLNVVKAREQRTLYQALDVALPVLIILAVAPVVLLLRRRRYIITKKK